MRVEFTLRSVGIHIAPRESRHAYPSGYLEHPVERIAKANKIIDLRGVSSPWSILKAKSQLIAMEPGEILEVLANESVMYEDFAKVIDRSEHQLVDMSEQSGFVRLYVRRGNKEEGNENTGFQANVDENSTQRR